jgi:AraC-like DNA-binding protein
MTDHIVFLAGAQGLMLAIALFVYGFRKRPANVHFGMLIMVCAIELLNTWAMSQRYHQQRYAFPFWILGSYLWVPPALAFYLAHLLSPGFVFNRKHLQWYLPALVEVVTELVVFYVYRGSGRPSPLSGNTAWGVLTEILPVCATLLVLLAGFRRWFRSGQESMVFPRAVSGRRKALVLLLVVGILTLLWLGESVVHLPFFPVTLFLLSLLLFVLGYMVYFQPDFYHGKEKALRQATLVIESPEAPEVLNRVQALMETDKLFLQPKLTLDMVAERAGAPARMVSAVINSHYGVNFSQLVNQYRVKEVLERIKDPASQHMTLLGIALDCGFNSKSSFNQIFKTVTGETPSAYLQKQKSAPAS